MSTEALPVETIRRTPVPLRPDGKPKRSAQYPTRYDRLRLDEFRRLRAEGVESNEAWRRVLLNPDLGYRRYLGNPAELTPGRVASLRVRFLRRVGDEVANEARDTAREELCAAAGDAARAITGMTRGEFSRGKIVTRGYGENAAEGVVIDAAAARVQLDASKVVLAAVGLSDKSSPTVNTAVQVNVGSVLDRAAGR